MRRGTAPSAGATLHWFRWRIVGVDYLFIPTYVTLLSATYLRLAPRPSCAGPAVTLVAGLLDVVENLSLWLLVSASDGPLTPAMFAPSLVWLMSAAAALKWSALAVFAVFLWRVTYAGVRADVLRLVRYGLLSLGVGTGVLILTGQGRDLISSLADGPTHRIVAFAVTLALWGTSVWYWSRIVLDGAYGALTAVAGNQAYPPLARQLPRALGALTLVLPVVPIWRAIAISEARRYWLIGICVALAATFLVTVVRRRTYMNRRATRVPLDFTLAAVRSSDALRVGGASMLVSLALFGFFVAAPVRAGDWLGTVAILFVAAANTVFFGSLVVFASRIAGWPIELLAFSCAAVFSFWNDNHRVRSEARVDWQAKKTVDRQFREWAAELRAQPHVEGGRDVPVFLIAAEGGGIRAAYWTGTVLAALNDQTDQRFAHHVFAISGISGGSLGAAFYAALRRDAPTATMRPVIARMMQPGYLAAVSAKTVTGDFLQWFLPLPVPAFDRSSAMESGFATSYAREVPDAGRNGWALEQPFLQLTPSAGQGVPALVLSATSVETGARVITAPFTWTATEIPNAIDYHRFAGHDLSLARAVHNSARFAYVSPAGLVPSMSGAPAMHVIDGGYFDTSGIDTLLDLHRVLKPLAEQAGMRLVPLFVGNTPAAHLRCPPLNCAASPGNGDRQNGDRPQDATTAVAPPSPYEGNLQPVEILGELFSPVRGVLRARGAHGRLAEDRMDLLEHALSFRLCDTDWTADGSRQPEPAGASLDPPLGWEISPWMVRRLDQLWTECDPQGERVDEIRRHLGMPGLRR